MAENGILDYQGMNQAIYRGATSNIVVDTQSMSIEIGAGNTIHTSNLHFECNHDANVASVQLNSNVVTEFSRSKKLIKYPRVALSANSDSGYVASASSYYNTGVQPYQAFDVVNGGLGWESGPNSQNGNGRYSSGSTFNTTYLNDNPTLGEGGFQTTAGSTTYTGEWVQIQLPVSIQSTTHVFGNSDANSDWNLRIPQSGVILGSTNGSSWELIHSFDDTIKNATITVSHTKYYSYFRLVVLSVGTNQTLANVPEWEIFGTPEYDPEAAGVDIKMTSYPNVPNTDWLEVYYDAKESSSYPGTGGTVLDLSGNQINGTLNGGVGFDSEYKAFTFDEADDYITLDTGKTGNYIFSVSLWFKSSGNSIETLFHMNGDYATNNTVWIKGDATSLSIGFVNNDYSCDTGKEIADNMWHHASFVYNGNGESGRDIYLDGIHLGGSLVGSSAGDNLNLTSTSSISRIGALNHSSLGIIHEFKGSIANFRLFNRALSQDEIYQLYAYQKEYFGHGDLSMTLKAGRLGIGTSEPRAALDVKGEPFGPGSRPGFLVSVKSNVNRQFGASNGTYTTLYSSPLPIFLTGELKYNISKCLSFHDYAGRKYIKFTAPANGIYNFGLALGHTRNIHSASDYIGFGLMVNKEGAYADNAGANYTELDYYFTEYEASKMFPVDAQITMNGNINIQLNKSDFVVYYSRSVENVELISTYSAWGHIVQYL